MIQTAAQFLVTIGVSLLVIAAASFLIAAWTKTIEKTLAKKTPIKAIRGKPSPFRVFSVQQTSTLKGSISARAGAFGLYIFPLLFDPYKAEPDPQSILDTYHKEKAYAGKEFRCKVEKGNVCVFFHSTTRQEPQIETELNLTLTWKEYPYKRLFDFGLALLQVAIPLLITGIVLSYGVAFP